MPRKKPQKIKLNPRFEVLKDGFIRDYLNKIDRGPYAPKKMTHKDGIAYCEAMGCYMEDDKDVESLIDRSKFKPAVVDGYPGEIKTDDWQWTRKKCAWNDKVYWCVSFDDGNMDISFENYEYYVRPVRASQ